MPAFTKAESFRHTALEFADRQLRGTASTDQMIQCAQAYEHYLRTGKPLPPTIIERMPDTSRNTPVRKVKPKRR